MKMYKYKVGQVVDNFKRHSEGVHFDIADDGATMLVFFQNPTTEEIEQFKSGKNFEIRFTELYGVIMITVKIGDLNWMDAPYSPHLSENLTKFSLPGAGEGLGLTLLLVDAETGEIKSIRLIGLSERFSRVLIGAVMEQKTKEFDKVKYDSSVSRIFAAYKTSQIVKLSRDYCKIND
jgi:hypothetical protein